MIKRKKLLLLFLFLSGLYLLYNNYYKLFEYYYGSTKRQRLPQALIIGVRKGGTRALINALSLHPSIKAARKEQHYFDYDDNYEKGIDWYRNQMPKTDGNQVNYKSTFQNSYKSIFRLQSKKLLATFQVWKLLFECSKLIQT